MGAMAMKCYICGHDMSLSQESHHYIESGLDNVYLMNIDIYRCHECTEKVVNLPAVPQLNRLICIKLLEKESLLNGKEIRFLRKNMGLRAQQLKNMIGVDAATLSRWENGSQKISQTNDRLIRIIYANIMGIPNDQIKNLIEDRFKDISVLDNIAPLYQIDTKEKSFLKSIR